MFLSRRMIFSFALATALAIGAFPFPPLANAKNTAFARDALQLQNRKGLQVSVSFSFNLPLPSGDAEDIAAVQEKGRRAIYQMAAKECVNLLATIAEQCEITRIHVNSRHNAARRNRAASMHVSGNATYRISPK